MGKRTFLRLFIFKIDVQNTSKKESGLYGPSRGALPCIWGQYFIWYISTQVH